MRFMLPAAALAALSIASPAVASDEAVEFWFNPSAEFALDDDTAVEIETAQRFRDADDGRADTYFGRLWIKQDVAQGITLSGAFERRINDGGDDETRLIQQMTVRSGILRGRLRTEQRFVDDADRMGMRLRPRIGVSVPLDEAGRWSLDADAEGFFTLRSTSRGGQDGLTGLRTQLGLGYEVSDRLAVSLTYLRQQDIRDNRPDIVGHAPLVGIELSF